MTEHRVYIKHHNNYVYSTFHICLYKGHHPLFNFVESNKLLLWATFLLSTTV